MDLLSRIKHAWNAFSNTPEVSFTYRESGNSVKPDRVRYTRGNERSLVTAIYNRIALDVSALDFLHVQLDEHGQYKETIDSPLNQCLTLSANLDQTGTAFIHDVVSSMLDEGQVALVPIDIVGEPIVDPTQGTTDILSIRTGKIIEWYPSQVLVECYNERTGKKQRILRHKNSVAIIENPFYAIMNESNSTLQRLIRKLNILDALDEKSNSGKLDLIIQLPYTIRSETKLDQANKRKKMLEDQLSGSKYGIAYIDSTEHITQLNRAVENNLLPQIQYLQGLLFSQLGITQGILDGSADEATKANYYARIIEPIASAIVDECKRKFISRTAITQGKSIMYFRDPFKLVAASQISEIADKFTRNEILSPNEIRQIIGRKPSDDPAAGELRNRNINQNSAGMMPDPYQQPYVAPEEDPEAAYDETDEEDMTPEEYKAQLISEMQNILQELAAIENETQVE